MTKQSKITILFILVLAAIMRLYGIWWSLPDEDRLLSYSADESTIFLMLEGMNPSKLDFVPELKYFQTTLQVYIVGIGIKLASWLGFVDVVNSREFYLSHPEEFGKMYLTGRIIACIFGISTVYLVYLAGKGLWGEAAGIISAAFFSVIPLHVVHSKLNLFNVPLVFWWTLTFVFAVMLIKSPRKIWYVLGGIATGMAMGTKYNGILAAISIITAHLLIENSKLSMKTIKSLFSGKIILFYAVTLCSFLIVFPAAIFAPGQMLKEASRILGFINAPYSDSHHLHSAIGWFSPIKACIFSVRLPVLLASLIGLSIAIFRRNKEDILLLANIIPYYLVLAYADNTSTSRAMPLMPFISILAAVAVINIGRWKQWVVPFATVVIFIYTFCCSIPYVLLFGKEDIRDTAGKWIVSNIPHGSEIGVPPAYYVFSPQVLYKAYKGYSPYDYKVIVVNSEEELVHQLPPYVVISDIQTPNLEKEGLFSHYELEAHFSRPRVLLDSLYIGSDRCPDLNQYPEGIRIYRIKT